MINTLSKEAIIEVMNTDKELVAELVISQRKMIDTLTQLVEDYRARLELVLLDSEKDELH